MLCGGIFGDKASAQAENFKKLLLTMSDDIRVILIKICDRLHNMRTLASQAPNKQYKIAGETMYIYAPLANRLGLNKIKTELEDLSFKYEHPEEYKDITNKLSMSEEQRQKLFKDFTTPIRAALDSLGIQYEIKARVKSPYSIWNKMQNKHVSFDEIYDILAVRIIFTPKERANEINECFNIYVAISRIYKSHPDRLRDWLNHPKANGYQALHVTLMSKQGKWIEVQIRSDRMDEIAEQGFAAHWKYKDGNDGHEDDGELNDWLSTIKEILDDPQPDAMDFLDAIKLNLFASEIFVFTPKGEVKTMPANCTVLDFAFQIHTFLGSHCIGAKVNHKLVPLSHKLNSGDQVEVLTSKSQHVQPDWINFVSTAKAKAKIQAILRRDNRETQKKGEETLKQWLQTNEIELSTSVLDKLCSFHGVQKPEELFLGLGNRTILLGEKDINELHGNSQKNESSGGGWRKFVPFLSKSKDKKGTVPPSDKKLVVGKEFNKKIPCVISEKTIGMYILPTCCHAIPGDDILGYIDNKNQVEIHNRACPVANRLKSSFGNRILDAKWVMHKVLFFDATIQIRGIDRKGMLHDISEVISEKLDVNIHRITINADEGIYDGKIEIRVHDRSEAQEIVNALKKIDDLKEVKQIM
jgi:GTP diphosphokinase / guanosine-3',5'-bis(diphosphate) 3'-diphosphatase